MSQSASRPALLEMRGISKTFPGVRALNNVCLSVQAGEIHSLMGENGAGKSTLMKILSGAYQADPGGEIRVDGVPSVVDGPLTARALGIAVIYQEFSLAPNLTVAENIYVGRELRRPGGGFRTIDRDAMEQGCEAVLTRLGASFGPRALVGSLSIAEQQLVEIARAVHSRARILVMDEPTTPLSSRETDRLFELIRQLRAEGLAIIYISHRMAEIYELSDRVSVLRDGTYVGTLERSALSADSLVQMMVGRDLSGFYKQEHTAYDPGNVVLSVRDIADEKRVRGCSFDLHAGEVLGIAGLVGAGRTELARLIFGAEPRTRGDVSVDGRTFGAHSPCDAIDAGLVYLTEDRKRQGLFLDMSVRDNINISVCGRDA
ncbi:D-ribose transporter ATP-binding protein, partial [Burkholderia ubonensis]|uniref:sugar ABC transporter ATP-binding protein n=1 Tax=Burkholderia ubonensis TaxID=101571 RepID=UPI0007549CC3